MLPALFVSHGAPTLPFDDGPARDFLTGLAGTLPRPEAIVVVSAHWETPSPMLTAAESLATIHDFSGFPRALYALRYNAPGAPDLAASIASHLQSKGLAAGLDPVRGLDHGAWVPLLLMYPKADIPVVQLSIQPHLSPADHIALGAALKPLRKNVLILASGGYVHNLRALSWDGEPEPDWSQRFSAWMGEAVLQRRTADLADYRRLAPDAVRAHPSEDHILPLFVAYGAGDEVTQLHRSVSFGALRMDAFKFA